MSGRTSSKNSASKAMLNKLGFSYTGEQFYEPTGLNHPSYELLNEEGSHFTVRIATEADVESIRTAHRRSILEIAAKDYPPEIVAEWGSDNSPEAILQHKEAIRSGEEVVWVAEIEGKVEGFSALIPANNEVRAVYVTKRGSKRGLGKALLAALEARAKELGLNTLTLQSSITAKGFYESNGYLNLGEGAHRMRSGREMVCFFMKKDLN